MDLCKIDPAKTMRRFYRLSVEPTLFGDFALVREWGRVGAKAGRTQEDRHALALDAQVAHFKGNTAPSRAWLYAGMRARHSHLISAQDSSCNFNGRCAVQNSCDVHLRKTRWTSHTGKTNA